MCQKAITKRTWVYTRDWGTCGAGIVQPVYYISKISRRLITVQEPLPQWTTKEIDSVCVCADMMLPYACDKAPARQCGLQSPQYTGTSTCQPAWLNLAAHNALHLKASLQPQCQHPSVIIQSVKVTIECHATRTDGPCHSFQNIYALKFFEWTTVPTWSIVDISAHSPESAHSVVNKPQRQVVGRQLEGKSWPEPMQYGSTWK